MFDVIISSREKMGDCMLDVVKLYPQYNLSKERRKEISPVSPVGYERRSGDDRRSEDRVKLDSKLTQDIFELKSKISQLNPGFPTTKSQEVSFTRNATTAIQNNIKADQFIKSAELTPKNLVDTPAEAQKANSQNGALGGVLATVLGGTLATALLGGLAGIGVTIGVGAYFGGKFLKNAIVSHIKNK